MSKLLLCTDMDRTVIPNGVQAEPTEARQRFSRFCADPRVSLVYVSGRHRALVEEALRIYQLPRPDYVITDVGTKIYQAGAGEWQELLHWEQQISHDWQGKSHQDIRELFRDIKELKLQERSKQNTHKLSYYLPLHVDEKRLLATMGQRLQQHNIDASLVWSIDEPKGVGLLDLLPRNATKLHAIDFLRQSLDYSLAEVVFAGDSGNDLPVMASPIPSVLVANASDDVKADALQLAQQSGHMDSLYIASGAHLDMNGNYAAGVLEGVWHFASEFRSTIEESL